MPNNAVNLTTNTKSLPNWSEPNRPELICLQMTTDEIAEKLFISPKTVNGHRNSLLQKTGAHNVAGLVIYAVKNGLVKVL